MKEVVSAIFINKKEEILILKRSPHKKHYPNLWDTMVGRKEENETIVEALHREIKEELGIEDFSIIKQSKTELYTEGDHQWNVTIFLCQMEKEGITLNDEHTKYKWLSLDKIKDENCSEPFLKDLRIMFKNGFSAE